MHSARSRDMRKTLAFVQIGADSSGAVVGSVLAALVLVASLASARSIVWCY